MPLRPLLSLRHLVSSPLLSPPSCVCAQDAYFSDDSGSGGCADGSRRARKPATRVEAIRRVQANSRGAPMRASSADDYDY